jgi:hypothetical protein
MNARIWRRRPLLAAAAVGCLSISGCFAALERGFDMVYSPDATSNLLALPQSGLIQIAEFFARYIREPA